MSELCNWCRHAEERRRQLQRAALRLADDASERKRIRVALERVWALMMLKDHALYVLHEDDQRERRETTMALTFKEEERIEQFNPNMAEVDETTGKLKGIGDYLLAEVINSEPLKEGSELRKLILRCKEPAKDADGNPLVDAKGKPVLKEKIFSWYDIEAGRTYHKRRTAIDAAEAAGKAAPKDVGNYKYIELECNGSRSSGTNTYPTYKFGFTNDMQDMGKALKARGGSYYLLHPAPIVEKPSTKPAQAGAASSPAADDDIPF